MNAQECANELGISKPHAYKLIKQMNEELSKNGYIIINGRVPRNYFYERFYHDSKEKRYASTFLPKLE